MSEDGKQQLLRAANCGIEFAAAVFIGVVIGLWLDRYFDKFPLFMLIFLVFGSVAGYWNVLHYVKALDKKNTEKKNEPSEKKE